MSNVKTGDKQIREFLDTPLTRSRSQGSRKRSSSDPLLWMNVWLCLIVVIMLFQTVYSIVQAHRAEQKVERKLEEYFEQMQKISSSMDGGLDERLEALNKAFKDATP